MKQGEWNVGYGMINQATQHGVCWNVSNDGEVSEHAMAKIVKYHNRAMADLEARLRERSGAGRKQMKWNNEVCQIFDGDVYVGNALTEEDAVAICTAKNVATGHIGKQASS